LPALRSLLLLVVRLPSSAAALIRTFLFITANDSHSLLSHDVLLLLSSFFSAGVPRRHFVVFVSLHRLLPSLHIAPRRATWTTGRAPAGGIARHHSP